MPPYEVGDLKIEMSDGRAAGKAIGMVLARKRGDSEPVAHHLEIRAQILRDITPVVSVSGPGLPAIRGKNLEWAAGEMEAAAEIIRRLANVVPKTAQDEFNAVIVEKLTDALLLIQDGPVDGDGGDGRAAGVAMSALASVEEMRS